MENVKLNFVHVCENAFLSKDGNINIIGDFDRILVEKSASDTKLPYSFYVVTNFTVNPNQEYKQEILLVNVSNNNPVIEREVKQISPVGKIGLLLKLNIEFPTIGEYKVVIKLDGITYNELKIIIERQQD